MRNILVTGGAGFIGANFVHHVLAAEADVHIINLDMLTYAGSQDNLVDLPDPARHTFIQGDICDKALAVDLLHRYEIATIVHFAAETHVDRSIVDPEAFVQANILGTFTLLEAARQYWLVERALPLESVHFHHVSTDEVFGTLKPGDPAWTEDTPYAPNSPYSASKASSDHLVRAYGHTYGLPVTITNCSNNYGPFQFPEKLIPLMILNALSGKPLPIYGDGQQIRDWLYVGDHCEAIWNVVQRGHLGETYNIGGNNQPANLTIVQTICAILDELHPRADGQPYATQIQYVTDRPGHDRRYAMDISKISRELGWQPQQSLDTGLLKTVQWYLEHPAWVETVRTKAEYAKWIERNYTERESKP